MVFLPLYPYFFIDVMQSFSWLPVCICLLGVFVQIYMRGIKRIYDVVYIIPSLIVGVLMYHAVYLLTHGDYIYLNIYSRLFDYISYPYFSSGYIYGLVTIIFELSIYFGVVVLFFNAIYVSFSFIKERNFDSVNKYVFHRIAFAFLGNFLASGVLVRYFNGGLFDVIYNYELLLYFFKNII